MRRDRFCLTKWYMDCLAPDGRSAIAYWAACSWHGVQLAWHNLTVYAPDGSRRERSSRRRIPPPSLRDGVLQWAAPALRGSVRAVSRCPPFAHRLLDGGGADVDWSCEAAAADTVIHHRDGAPLRGAGYVECLTLRVAPWRLPIDELRWGRWIANDLAHSLVWIQWRGPQPLSVVWLDGRPLPQGEIGARAVATGRARLTLGEARVLQGRSLRAIAGRLGLAPMLPRSILALSQTRWRSPGTLVGVDAGPCDGWVVHEVVRLR